MQNKIIITFLIYVNVCAYFISDTLAQSVSNSPDQVLSESSNINPISYGILDPSKKPMSSEVWNDTHQENILPLLSILPESNLPSLHMLTYRLLISEAFPPLTASGTVEESMPYAKYRIEWLIENGHTTDAIRLIQFIPQEYRLKSFGRTLIDLYLANKDYPKSCSLSTNHELWNNKDISYRQQVNVFCLVLDKKYAQAEFNLSLYQENNHPEDSLFDTLINFLLFDIKPDNSLGLDLNVLSPLHISMLGHTDLDAHIIDEDAPSSYPMLETLSHNNNLSLKQRLIIAERLAIKQPKTIDNLQNIFSLFAINSLNENPDTEISNSPSLDNQAIIYSKTIFSKRQNERAKLLKLSLELSDSSWFVMVKLHEMQLLSIAPSSELSWFAPTAARAMFALGHIKDASQWFEVIPHDDPHKRGALALLYFIGQHEKVISPQIIITEDSLNSKNPENNLISDTYLSIAQLVHKDNNKILQDLHNIRQSWIVNNPQILLSSLPTTEPISTTISFFEEAVDNQKIGYAILLANIALSSQKSLSPQIFTNIIEGLQKLGLDKEAMDIIREYIIFYLKK